MKQKSLVLTQKEYDLVIKSRELPPPHKAERRFLKEDLYDANDIFDYHRGLDKYFILGCITGSSNLGEVFKQLRKTCRKLLPKGAEFISYKADYRNSIILWKPVLKKHLNQLIHEIDNEEFGSEFAKKYLSKDKVK